MNSVFPQLTRLALAAMCLLAATASAQISTPRKTSAKNFRVVASRVVLENGLVVILSPDKTMSGVVVDLSFRAGALYEPADRGGLAHLVEHLMASGRAPDVQYQQQLQARGGRAFNAFTSYDTMMFRVVVPSEELPFALWVNADRLGTLRHRFDDAELERNRKIVLEERTLRKTDAPFGAADLSFYSVTFPASHALHGAVIGSKESLNAVTLADATRFIDTYLVPANGVLTLTGDFDPKVATEWATKLFSALPAGKIASAPVFPAVPGVEKAFEVSERNSRHPRVSMGWLLPNLSEPSADALALGAILLGVYLDGAWGTQLDASLMKFSGGGVFRLDVTLPHDKTRGAAQDDADALLRYLTRAAVPVEVLDATWLALDRQILQLLDTPEGTASFLTWVELSGHDVTNAAAAAQTHWSLTRYDIQEIARTLLESTPRVLLHVRPLRPKQVGTVVMP